MCVLCSFLIYGVVIVILCIVHIFIVLKHKAINKTYIVWIKRDEVVDKEDEIEYKSDQSTNTHKEILNFISKIKQELILKIDRYVNRILSAVGIDELNCDGSIQMSLF